MTRKRFSVSLEVEDYQHLRDIGHKQKPRLSLQYLTEYAVRLLLEKADDPQFQLALRDPVRRP